MKIQIVSVLADSHKCRGAILRTVVEDSSEVEESAAAFLPSIFVQSKSASRVKDAAISTSDITSGCVLTNAHLERRAV